MSEDYGRPIRSADLERAFATREGQQDALARAVEGFERRAQMIEWALLTRSPSRPQSRSPGEEGLAYLDLTPTSGGMREGPFACGLRSSSSSPAVEEPVGSGELELLEPDRVWAALAEEKTETFEARLEPARLISVNEILIPHLGGQILLTLYTDQGSRQLGPYRESRLVRLEEPLAFNGRLELTSTSSTTAEGRYVHACGGLTLWNASWTDYEAEAELVAPRGGSLEVTTARLHPSGREVSFEVYLGGVEQGGPAAVEKDDVLTIKLPNVAGRRAASLLVVSYRYV